jgi:hypothetical protein
MPTKVTTDETMPIRDEIIRIALNLQTGGDDPVLVDSIREMYPEGSRGELADAFSAAADEMRRWRLQPWLVSPNGSHSTADSFDEAAWGLLSRDDWPPPEPDDPDDDDVDLF